MASPTQLPGSFIEPEEPLPPAYINPAIRAIEAAEARARLPILEASSSASSSHSNEIFNPSAADKLPFHRLIDSTVSLLHLYVTGKEGEIELLTTF